MAENETNHNLTDATRARLRSLSKSLLRLHKTLLDFERANYERANGRVHSTGEMFRLVLDDPHFAWLRILSGQIVLIDEFLASKQETFEKEGANLVEQTRRLLNFEDQTEHFSERFQNALQNSPDAVLNYNETLSRAGNNKREN